VADSIRGDAARCCTQVYLWQPSLKEIDARPIALCWRPPMLYS